MSEKETFLESDKHPTKKPAEPNSIFMLLYQYFKRLPSGVRWVVVILVLVGCVAGSIWKLIPAATQERFLEDMFSETPQKNISVTLTDPPHGGMQVRKTYMVRGTASIPSSGHLWVLTRREDFDGQWWPQNEAKVDPVSHNWKVSVTFGNPDDIGWQFDLAIIVVADSQHTRLRNYRNSAVQSGDWQPIAMPEVLIAPVRRSVHKVGH